MGIRVLLAEDNALLRQGLERLIEHDDALELVGSVADLPSLQKAVAEHEPDVVVSDIRMPPTKTDEGIQMAAAAARRAAGHRRRAAQPARRRRRSRCACSRAARAAAPTCSRSGSATSAS